MSIGVNLVFYYGVGGGNLSWFGNQVSLKNIKFDIMRRLILVFSAFLMGAINLFSQFATYTKGGGIFEQHLQLYSEALPATSDYWGKAIVKNTSSDYYIGIKIERKCIRCSGDCSGINCPDPYATLENLIYLSPGQEYNMGYSSKGRGVVWRNTVDFDYKVTGISWFWAAQPQRPFPYSQINDGTYSIRVAHTDHILGLDMTDTTLHLVHKDKVPSILITSFIVSNTTPQSNKICIQFDYQGKRQTITWNPRGLITDQRKFGDNRPYILNIKDFGFEIYKLVDRSYSRYSICYTVGNIHHPAANANLFTKTFLYSTDYSTLEYNGTIHLDSFGNYFPRIPDDFRDGELFANNWIFE